MEARAYFNGRAIQGGTMPDDPTTVVRPAELYDRFADLAGRAGLSVAEIADQAGVRPNALYALRSRGRAGSRTAWSMDTLHAISRTLAHSLNAKPSEVYAHLTGLEDGPWNPRSA
jgi:hypothetical protein